MLCNLLHWGNIRVTQSLGFRVGDILRLYGDTG